MAAFQISDRIGEVFDTLQVFDTPMFMVLVQPNGTMRFLGLNRAHERATGIGSGALAGRTPHSVLPPRVADTVCANYQRCLDTAGPTTYEEILELPTGLRTWRTTLVPIIDDGRIAAILGTSFDITQQKEQLDSALTEIAALKRRGQQLRTLSKASVSQMRGPLNNILTLSRLLRDELRPPLDQKVLILDMLMETAVSALDEIDGYEAGHRGIVATEPAAVFDLGHICRDIAALVDPGRDLCISFPDIEIAADADSVRWILHSALDRLLPIVGCSIKIAAVPACKRANAITFTLVCDLLDAGQATLLAEDRNWLRAGIESRGGEFEVFNCTSDHAVQSLELRFVLPGRLVVHI